MNIGHLVRALALALLFLPCCALADNTDVFINTGGSATYNPLTQTLTLTSSGPLTVTTGTLTSGSIGHHAFFGPSTLNLGGMSGTLYSLNWYQVPNSNEFHLSGTGEITLNFNHYPTQICNFDQLMVLSGTNQFTVLNGRIGLVPEPSTVSLLASGLILFSVAGVVRRKRVCPNTPV